ncbi:MAG TPA: hypothetical protein PKV78_08585 [Methanoculleus thermophilus]|nr:hypothetical protein [Methanoculleus thermophilus]
MIDAGTIAVGALAIVVAAPPLYAWADRWLDRTRSTEVDIVKTKEKEA